MSVTLQAVVAIDTSAFKTGLESMRALTMNAVGAMTALMGDFGKEMLSMTQAFGVFGTAAAGLKAATTAGSEFQTLVAEMRAETRYTSDEVKALSDIALSMSGKMTWSAGQIVTAMKDLHSAGIMSTEGIRDSLVPALQLADVAGKTTADTARELGKTLANFGMGADQATAAVNSMAAAVGADDLKGFSSAMLEASKTASGLGISMAETFAVLSKFNDAGIEGEAAGKAFTQVLDKLAEAARNGKGALGEALTGWNPAATGIAGALDRINASGVSMQEVFEKVGPRAAAAMMSLSKDGGAALADLTQKISNGSSMAELYAIKNDTLGSSFKTLRNSIENINIAGFQPMADGMKRAVEIVAILVQKIPELAANLRQILGDAITKAVAWFNGLDSAVKGIVAGLGGLSAAFVLVGPALLSFGNAVITASLAAFKAFMAFAVPVLATLATLTVAFAAFSLGETIGNVKAGSDTINGHIQTLFTNLLIKFEGFYEKAANWFAQLMEQIKIFVLDKAPGVVEAFAKMIAPIIEKFGAFRAAIMEALGMDEAAAEVRKNADEMAAALRKFDAGVALDSARAELAKLQTEMAGISDKEAVRMKAAMEMAGAAAAENLKKGIEPAQVFDKWIQQMGDNGGKMWDGIVASGDKAKGMFAALMEKMGITGLSMEDLTTTANGTGAALAEIGGKAATGANGVNGLKKESEGLKMTVTDMVDTLAKFKQANLSAFDASDFSQSVKSLAQSLKGIAFDDIKFPDFSPFLNLPKLNQHDIGEFANGLQLLKMKLGNFKMDDLKLPDFGRMEIPKLNSHDISEFTTGLTKLAAGLRNIAFNAIEMPDFSAFKIPKLSQHDVSEFLASLGTLKGGLARLDLGGLGTLTIPGTDAAGGGSATMAGDIKAIKDFLTNAKGVLWA